MNDPHDVCECGDYRRQHPGGTGPCGYCAWSRAPYDNCTHFRFSHHGEPIPLQRRDEEVSDEPGH